MNFMYFDFLSLCSPKCSGDWKHIRDEKEFQFSCSFSVCLTTFQNRYDETIEPFMLAYSEFRFTFWCRHWVEIRNFSSLHSSLLKIFALLSNENEANKAKTFIFSSSSKLMSSIKAFSVLSRFWNLQTFVYFTNI